MKTYTVTPPAGAPSWMEGVVWFALADCKRCGGHSLWEGYVNRREVEACTTCDVPPPPKEEREEGDVKGGCDCLSSPPGFVMEDGVHCGGCGGHFPFGASCEKHGWFPMEVGK